MTTNACTRVALAIGLLLIVVTTAAAQSATQGSEPGKIWIVAGGSSTTLLGDCTGCAADTYLHTGAVLGIVGKSITRRTDGGVEVLWVPNTAVGGGEVPIRTTFLTGAFQFRPWMSKGFFVRFNVGMAFVRNWTIELNGETPPITSKAFAVGLGAGWEWRFNGRVGGQIFGTQHVAALGDLTAADTTAENVMGNFWSVGAAIVIR
jgi:hypothetical protein